MATPELRAMRIRRRWRRRIRLAAGLLACCVVVLPLILLIRNSPQAAQTSTDDANIAAPTHTSTIEIAELETPSAATTRQVVAISPDGLAVEVQFDAADSAGSEVRPTCIPASGSLFSVGTTAVTCTATTMAGDVAVSRLDIVVSTASAPAGTDAATEAPVAATTLATAGTLPSPLGADADALRLAAAFSMFGAGFAVLGAEHYNRGLNSQLIPAF